MSGRRFTSWILAVGLATALPGASANAQEPTPAPRPAPAPDRPAAPDDIGAPDAVEPADDAPPPKRASPAIRVRVFGLVGFQSFTAADSFSAVLDTSSGGVFGGGGGVLFGRNLFVDVSVHRFSADGARVFVTDGGEVVNLGIDTQVAVTPIDVSIGWRFAGAPKVGPTGKPRFRPVPFAGGGFGVQQYKETSEFADRGDDVSESHGSYHVLGGVELPLSRHVGLATDVLYRWVPDAIGTAGVSAFYEETDLGGAQVRLKVVVTF